MSAATLRTATKYCAAWNAASEQGMLQLRVSLASCIGMWGSNHAQSALALARTAGAQQQHWLHAVDSIVKIECQACGMLQRTAVFIRPHETAAADHEQWALSTTKCTALRRLLVVTMCAVISGALLNRLHLWMQATTRSYECSLWSLRRSYCVLQLSHCQQDLGDEFQAKPSIRGGSRRQKRMLQLSPPALTVGLAISP